MYAGVAERSLNRFRAIAAFSVLTDQCRVHRSSKNQFEPFGRVDTPEHGSTRELAVSINGNSRKNLGTVGGGVVEVYRGVRLTMLPINVGIRGESGNHNKKASLLA
jgi:hypothetical protein